MWLIILVGTGTTSAPFIGIVTLRAVQRVVDRSSARHWQTLLQRDSECRY